MLEKNEQGAHEARAQSTEGMRVCNPQREDLQVCLSGSSVGQVHLGNKKQDSRVQ